MAAISVRGQAMRQPTNKYLSLRTGSVYTFPDKPRKKERAPRRQPLDFAESASAWDRASWLENPIVAIAGIVLIGLLFAIAFFGG